MTTKDFNHLASFIGEDYNVEQIIRLVFSNLSYTAILYTFLDYE